MERLHRDIEQYLKLERIKHEQLVPEAKNELRIVASLCDELLDLHPTSEYNRQSKTQVGRFISDRIIRNDVEEFKEFDTLQLLNTAKDSSNETGFPLPDNLSVRIQKWKRKNETKIDDFNVSIYRHTVKQKQSSYGFGYYLPGGSYAAREPFMNVFFDPHEPDNPYSASITLGYGDRLRYIDQSKQLRGFYFTEYLQLPLERLVAYFRK